MGVIWLRKAMNETEIVWKQYDQHITTYKFYLDMLVKLMTMHFAVSGAMLSFYFTKNRNTGR